MEETVMIYYIPAIVSAAATAVFGVISAMLVRRMDNKIKCQEKESGEQVEREQKRQEEHAALVNGMQAILRDRLIQAYNHYEDKGELPIYAMENIQKMYNAYHNLGGNGTITKLYNKMQRLPQSKEND